MIRARPHSQSRSTTLWLAALLLASAFLTPRSAHSQDAYDQSAAALYARGLELRTAGNEQGAFRVFRLAAERGYARAQRRLAEIYDRGNAAVSRDYVEAIRWYQRAREQGESIATAPRRSFGVLGYGG